MWNPDLALGVNLNFIMSQSLNYKCIVFIKDRYEILLHKSKFNELSLPSYEPVTCHVAVTNHINDFLYKNYGIKTNVLRAYKQIENIRIYEVEFIEEVTESFTTNYIWLDILRDPNYDYLNNQDQKILKCWLLDPTPAFLPWFKAGWRGGMEQKVNDELNEDLQFEQVRSWERSTLYKIFSTHRNYYLKAVPDVFKHELMMSNYLSQHYPSSVPELIMIDHENQWYIMEEMHGPLLGNSKQLYHWRQALYKLIEIQKKSVLNLRLLKDMKLPERPITTIVKQYLKLSLEQIYQTGYLKEDLYNELLNEVPNIIKKCNRIEKTNVPSTIEHGDFFGGNVIIHNNEPIIYDWSDSTLSHPFLSIIVLLDEVRNLFTYVEANQLLDEYISQWTDYDSKENLYSEYNIIKKLAPCYYLTLYQTFIFPEFRENWEKEQIIKDYINEWKSQKA